MRKRLVVLAALLTACGSVSQEEVDAAPQIDAAPQGDAAAANCSPEQTFGTPVLVPGLSSSVAEGAARFAPGELTVLLSRGDATVADILVARRPSAAEDFGAATALPGFNDPNVGTQHPTLTADGLTMVFTRSRNIAGAGEIASLEIARRTTIGGQFAAPTPLDQVNQNPNLRDTEPYLTPSGERLYFVSQQNGNSDIYVSNVVANDYGPPTRLDELASGGPDLFPVVSDDELSIYFGRLPSGPGGNGLDIMVATRASTTEPFGGIRAVDELNNLNSGERPTWISPDQCRLYLISNRNGGQTEIFVAERTP